MKQAIRKFAWDDLRFFLAVCRSQTVSAAAQQLGVDHATVSRRVARLERALNAKLFEHQKSGYVPTVAGERFHRMVEEVETSIMACQAEMSNENLDLEGVVRIGAPDGFGSYFLAPHLAAFCKENTKLRINLIATARVFNLAQREIDIAISLALPKEGRVIGRKLVDYELKLFASRRYIENHDQIRSISDLPRHQFIGYIEELVFTPLLDYLPIISKEITPNFRSNNLLAQLQAVREGEGIAVIPQFIAAKVDGLVPILPSEVKLQRTFYILLHEDNKNLARVREVANYIYNQVNRQADIFSTPSQRT